MGLLLIIGIFLLYGHWFGFLFGALTIWLLSSALDAKTKKGSLLFFLAAILCILLGALPVIVHKYTDMTEKDWCILSIVNHELFPYLYPMLND